MLTRMHAHTLPSLLLPLSLLQEFYGDFLVLGDQHFVVPVPCNDVLLNPRAAAALGASE